MTNNNPIAIVISGDGINCESETVYGLELAGFNPSSVHISRLLKNPSLLDNASLLVLPGGFSFGDEIASGRVLAIKLVESLKEHINKFVDSGKLVIGICNGFQALIQMGLLPEKQELSAKNLSLKENNTHRFINKWVDLRVPEPMSKTGFMKGLEKISLPVRHGEGRLAVLEKTKERINGNCALVYEEDINGSFNQIAALQSDSGNVLGMMPHPEAFVRWTHHPNWTALKLKNPEILDDRAQDLENLPHGLRILKNARSMVNR